MQDPLALQATISTVSYIRYVVLFPFLGVLFNIFLAPRLNRRISSFFSPCMILLSFCFAFGAFLQLPDHGALLDVLYPWIYSGSLQVDLALRFDALSATMTLIITGVGFLIHVYSVGYMASDKDIGRYFAYLNLFTTAMLLLVLGDNLLLLFIGWEGVGLCSYLLIGFWYNVEENANAGKKAFIVNRIGDAGFLLGLFLLFWSLGEQGIWALSFDQIQAGTPSLDVTTATIICLLFFVAATGKSAQIPLYIWLPDAMAGPTPVSALIHAATMVTAGIYLLARMHFLFSVAPDALAVIATVGTATAFLGATVALVQTDIKKVLAYSTVSQLGYMFLGLGVGAYTAAIFHVMTHAFFKALLFLGAGSVMHGMSNEQDIRKMGGLKKKMPTTYGTFAVGCFAISGFPFLSGFFSKDLILEHVYASPHGSGLLWVVATLGAGLTAFYMFRLLFLTFWGENRADQDTAAHIHESPSSMTVPLVILAILSLIGGYFTLPQLLSPLYGDSHPHVSATIKYSPTALGILGITLAYWFYVRSPGSTAWLKKRWGRAHRILLNKYYVDEFYMSSVVNPIFSVARWLWNVWDTIVIDGIVNKTGEALLANGSVLRRWQTGNVQLYALSLCCGAIMILGYYLW